MAIVLILPLVAANDPQRVGRIVLLHNDSVLEGDVTRVGDQFHVRRGDSEMTFSANEVAFVGDDLKAGYKFLLTRSDANKADDRLRLAKWCHKYGLKAEAKNEVEAALAIKPNWLPALTVQQQLNAPLAAVPAKPSNAPFNSGDPVDASPEAMKLFGTKIQPILANACAGCHSVVRSKFDLKRSSVAISASMANVQHNLNQAARQIDRNNPAKSPLLLKSVSAHGGAISPPIKDTNQPTYKHLEAWVKLMAPEPAAATPTPKSTDSPLPQPVGQPSTGPAPAGPKDEFDPAIFNANKKPN